MPLQQRYGVTRFEKCLKEKRRGRGCVVCYGFFSSVAAQLQSF